MRYAYAALKEERRFDLPEVQPAFRFLLLPAFEFRDDRRMSKTILKQEYTAFTPEQIQQAEAYIQKMNAEEVSRYINIALTSLENDEGLSFLEIHDMARELATMRVRQIELKIGKRMNRKL